jgi:hypothetical protein
MAKSYTQNYKDKTSRLSGDAPLYLLEISHTQLAQPIRIVADNQDITSNGNVFTAFAFRITLPDDMSNQIPRAKLSIDNVGRILTQWLDASSGGRGAQVRVMQVMRNAPDVIEFDITMDLLSVRQNPLEVTGELGFLSVLDRAASAISYRPDNTPALF